MPAINTPELAKLLRRLDAWLYVHVERRTDRVTVHVRDAMVGTLDLESRSVVVNVPRGMAGLLLEGHPQLRGTDDSVSVCVRDPDSRAAAEAALGWRIELERFGPQLRAASP
jgi:hypothetical protein